MRRSSRGRPGPDGAPNRSDPPTIERIDVVRPDEFLGFSPTDGQLKAKSAFWVRWGQDPMVSPEHMSAEQIAGLCDTPSLMSWWRDPNFRAWFLQKETWREELEFAYSIWLRSMTRRLRQETLADKDLVQVGKLLGEMTKRVGKAAEAEAESRKKLSDEDAQKLFADTARALGWSPPAALSAASEGEK